MILRKISLSLLLLMQAAMVCSATKVEYVNSFENVNHPRILYWFINKDVLTNDRYLTDLDSIAKMPFDMVFLTARNGVDFFNYAQMTPVFEKLVAKAHSKNIKIGLQLWDKKGKVPEQKSARTLGEAEVMLDGSLHADCELVAKHIRNSNGGVIKSEFFKAWAFKKMGDGFFVPGTLVDVTSKVKVLSATPGKVRVAIDADKALAGYTIYFLAQHYYNRSDIYGGYESDCFDEVLEKYASIPFDGTALDEYTQIRVSPSWELKDEVLTERFYSPAMAEQFRNKYKTDIETALLSMRYVPQGEKEQRMKSINYYMDFMREAPLRVEKKFYAKSKEVFGANTFIGVHNTHHNSLNGDEIWVTGGNWWSVPRDYGHSDEGTITPIHMGIAQCATKNILYNMYYHKSVNTILKKASDDMAYGVRTHYHAYNDVQGWGAKIESDEFKKGIEPIEKSAALLNRFNPALPKMDILLIIGMEAVQNWYPNAGARNKYQLNAGVVPDKIAQSLWEQGYRVTLISSDVIQDKKLKVEKTGKMNLNGHIYENVVFLYPQYIKNSTLSLLKDYKKQGGKLLLFGEGGYDFDGKSISNQFVGIGTVCKDIPSLAEGLNQMGVLKNRLPGTASINEDGSYVATSYKSLSENIDMPFKVDIKGHTFSGVCRGMIAIEADSNGNITKLTATGLSELSKNDNNVLLLASPSDIYLQRDNGNYNMQLNADAKVIVNKL